MQDFYVAMKFNRYDITVKALYRLFVVCCMLHNVKVPGTTRSAHHYPKIQLMHLLILKYWSEKRTCANQMMLNNTGIYNEEFGETTFSILSRCTLGDTILDDFEHMNKIYTLLPVLRDLKSEVMDDISNEQTLSWRHKINLDGEEVTNAKAIFPRMIRQIVRGTFRVYDETRIQYTTAATATATMVPSSTPAVYMSRIDLLSYVDSLYTKINDTTGTYFLFRYNNIWPEAKQDVQFNPDDDVEPNDDTDEETDDELYVNDPVRRRLMQCHESKQICELDTIRSEETDQNDVSQSPYLSRGWNAWGTVNKDNVMYGRRSRKSPDRLTPSKRRIIGQNGQ